MPIDPRLLEMLRCPACRATVAPLPDQSGLLCSSCRRVYAILDGIPDMLVEDATMKQG